MGTTLPSDTIWKGVTDTAGIFQGLSKEWKDRIPTKAWHSHPAPQQPLAGEWVITGYQDDPLDILLLQARLTQGASVTTLPFSFLGDNVMPPPLVLPWGPPQQVVTSVVSQGGDQLRLLYQLVEGAGPTRTQELLGPAYRDQAVVNLSGPASTAQRFLDALGRLVTDPNLVAIDVLFNVHGSPGASYFTDGFISSSTLANRIQGLQTGTKLRTLYSGACYGATHANDLLQARFKVVSGAIGVNTDAAVAYPTFLALWTTGYTFGTAIQNASTPLTREPQDRLFKAMGFAEANSKKQALGKPNLTISSLP